MKTITAHLNNPIVNSIITTCFGGINARYYFKYLLFCSNKRG